jgi:hypothetical protein
MQSVIGKDRRKYHKSDLPIFLKRFAGFGDLAVHPGRNRLEARTVNQFGVTGPISTLELE